MDSADATTPNDALQHGPRPLPIFLETLRRETAASPQRRSAALKGLRLYQGAYRPPPGPAAPVLDHEGSTLLRGHGGPADAPPVVFVPSLINPPDILDLDEGRSLLRWMVMQKHRVLMVDWSTPDHVARHLDLTGHVEQRLLPLLARLDRPAVLVGYCVGGTLALAAARTAGAAGVAAVATPWRFAGYDDQARTAARRLWTKARPACEATGLVPMELLQALFWQLDPARTVAKFERFGTLEPRSADALAFLRLEDWANAGAPLPFAAAAQLFDWITGDDVPGRGAWNIDGASVRLETLACPSIAFVSQSDRIVPAATAPPLHDQRITAAGHVGMVVGSGRKAELWTKLDQWIRTIR